MEKDKLAAMLNYLLFRDCSGNAYSSDVTAQNKIVRHIAKVEGVEVAENDKEGISIKEFHKAFGKP